MKFGFVLPYGDARVAADIGHLAEESGWDGFFVWEPVWGWDAWVQLAAVAMRTGRIKIGTMISPISRMRPWKLASETVTLDHLSKGRLILSVGLGSVDNGFEAFGEETDRKTRAELLDEGLDILRGLWKGQPFNFKGKHYDVKETKFYPPASPLQKPGVPIWVVGAWPRMKSMRRALRYEGLLPDVMDEKGEHHTATPEDIRKIGKFVEANGKDRTSFDIVVEGKSPGDDPAKASAMARPYADAGATWWVESLWGAMGRPDAQELVRKRIQAGPPEVEPSR